MEKNRVHTEQRLLDAAKDLIATRGFRSLGVNEIARHAKVNKLLIYRYFGGLEGLLKKLSYDSSIFPNPEAMLSGTDDPDLDLAGLHARVMENLIRGLRARETMLEIMAWEMIRGNELTEVFARSREEGSEALFSQVKARWNPDHEDRLYFAIISAGLIHLLLRSRSASSWNGVDLHDEENWTQLFRLVEKLTRAYIQTKKAPEPSE
ncbi:MAG: TetR/AcrR family transcriptional regulator [Oligoflexus sp.]